MSKYQAADFAPGDMVQYRPGHASNYPHPDNEIGVVTSVRGDTVFVWYGTGMLPKATTPRDLWFVDAKTRI